VGTYAHEEMTLHVMSQHVPRNQLSDYRFALVFGKLRR
jgi:hypothetical protein